jgi:hypothetical protein
MSNNLCDFKPILLGMTITTQNLIQEEIKRRLNSGNASALTELCM